MLFLSAWKNRVIPSGLRWTPSAKCRSLICPSMQTTRPITAKRLLITSRIPLSRLKLRAGSRNWNCGGTSTSQTSTTLSACNLSTKLVMAERMPSTVNIEMLFPPNTTTTLCPEDHHLTIPRLVIRRRPHSPSSVEPHVHVSQLKQKTQTYFMKRLHQSTWFSCLKNANFKSYRFTRCCSSPIAAKCLFIALRNPLLRLKVRAGSLNWNRGGTSNQSNVDDPVDYWRRDVVPPQHHQYAVAAEDQHLSASRLVVRRRPHSPSSVEPHVHVSQLKQKNHKLISWRGCTNQPGFHVWKMRISKGPLLRIHTMLFLIAWKDRVIPSGLRCTPSFATFLSLIRLSRQITGPIAAKRLFIASRNPLYPQGIVGKNM